MEDLDHRYDRRTTRFVLVILGLLLIAGSLVTMLIISFSSAPGIDGSVLRLLAHLAWISLALLLGVLIFLAWTIMRFGVSWPKSGETTWMTLLRSGVPRAGEASCNHGSPLLPGATSHSRLASSQ